MSFTTTYRTEVDELIERLHEIPPTHDTGFVQQYRFVRNIRIPRIKLPMPDMFLPRLVLDEQLYSLTEGDHAVIHGLSLRAANTLRHHRRVIGDQYRDVYLGLGS